MSTFKVNKLRDTAGSADAITLDPNGGAVLAGVTTVSTIKVGSGVTISSDGDVFHTGICTATSFAGQIPAASIVGVCTSGLTKTGGFGKILQIVQEYDTSFTRAAVSTNTMTATTHDVTITPTQASSKILVNISGASNNNGDGNIIYLTIYRSINGGTFADIAPTGSGNYDRGFTLNKSDVRAEQDFNIMYLDSPSYSVGNAIVYRLYIRNNGSGTVEVPHSPNGEPVMCFAQEIAA